MLDSVAALSLILMFGVALLYTAGCDRLGSRKP